MSSTITITDFGQPDYLDGIEAQYCIKDGDRIVAYVFNRDDALLMAQALGSEVIWETR